MPDAKDGDRLTRLQQRKAELEQQIRREKAWRRKEERKRDTRRKIIAGGALLTEAEHNPEFAALCEQVLRRRIEKRDHSLFPGIFPSANDAGLKDQFDQQEQA